MKKSYKFGMILFAVLTVAGLASTTFLLVQDFSGCFDDIVELTDIIVVLLTLFYTVVGYKKPHGNLLKFLMLVDAIFAIPRIINDVSSGWIFLSTINIITVICIVYVAGRLDRIDQNKYLMPFILFLFIMARVVFEMSTKSSGDLIRIIGQNTGLIIWLDICVAYFLRYKQHREAGLEDTPKSK